MKLIMVPVIFSVGFLVFEHPEKMMDLYHAAYPSDPVKAAALNGCAENQNFNRLDSGDRAACYAGTYGKGEVPVALIPTPQPYYPYSPSHLPGNDIRRQEANSAYRHEDAVPARPVAQQHPTAPQRSAYRPFGSAAPPTTQQ